MKKLLGILVVAVFTTSSAFGGLVSLNPPMREVDESPDSTLVNFDLNFDTVDGGEFSAFRFLIGSNDALLMTDFDVFGDAIGFWGGLGGFGIDCSGTQCTAAGGGPVALPYYPVSSPSAGANVDLQGFVLPPGTPLNPIDPLNAPIFMGVLTVEIPGGTRPGVYDILVNGDLDGTSKVVLFPSNDTETLFGALGARGLGVAGQVTVVPEPATLALLGVGGLVALGRRRRKA